MKTAARRCRAVVRCRGGCEAGPLPRPGRKSGPPAPGWCTRPQAARLVRPAVNPGKRAHRPGGCRREPTGAVTARTPAPPTVGGGRVLFRTADRNCRKENNVDRRLTVPGCMRFTGNHVYGTGWGRKRSHRSRWKGDTWQPEVLCIPAAAGKLWMIETITEGYYRVCAPDAPHACPAARAVTGRWCRGFHRAGSPRQSVRVRRPDTG